MWVNILMTIVTIIALVGFGYLCYIWVRIFLGIFDMFMYMITLGNYNPNIKDDKDNKDNHVEKTLNKVKHPTLF